VLRAAGVAAIPLSMGPDSCAGAPAADRARKESAGSEAEGSAGFALTLSSPAEADSFERSAMSLPIGAALAGRCGSFWTVEGTGGVFVLVPEMARSEYILLVGDVLEFIGTAIPKLN
jgi:hypothetical protein